MDRTVTIVRHRVADFDRWKTAYDAYASTQAKHGVLAHQVLRSHDDADSVVVTHSFDSLEAAQSFMALPELKETMVKAGVDADSVKVGYYDEIETGALIAV